MKAFFRHAIALLLAAAMAPGLAALDLPVKRVNGSDLYYYTVRKGDTVFGIARTLGITREQIIKHNPAAADGLRSGSVLYFPVSEFSETNPGTAATDRPTFRYKVQRGETLFGLSHRFGVTPEEIVALNPHSNDGIRAGEYLIIPGTVEPADGMTNTPVHAAASSSATPAAVQAAARASEAPQAPKVEPKAEPTPAPTPEYTPVAEITEPMVVENQTPTGTVAVLLPLMLDDEAPSKAAQRAADFVKGLMLAAAEMGHDGSPVKFHVFDTKGSQAEITRLAGLPEVAEADVIIAPEDEASLAQVVAKANPETYIFNILAVQDTTYLEHDNIVQANIPHHEMYEKAVGALMENYGGYTPVFLISKGGRSEKIGFTNYARESFAAANIAPLEIAFEGLLQARDLEVLDPAGKYVFIPASGSLTEFNKFARALRAFRDEAPLPDNIALFGYPDWTIFRNDAAELLHSLGATFYTRFFANPSSADVETFERNFKTSFGTEPLATVPSQAMLGYDTARFIVTDLRENFGVFSPEIPADFTGLQSSFRFAMPQPLEENTPDPDGQKNGAVNTALYLITYLPGNGVASRVL